MSKIHTKSGSMCPICCEQIENVGIFLHKTRRQTHRLCINCGVEYLKPLVDRVTRNLRNNIRETCNIIRCPGIYHGELRNQCNKCIKIQDICVPDTLPLYTDIFRITFALQNPNVYLCMNPECGELIETHPFDSYIICTSCNTNWCKFCSRTPYHHEKCCIELDFEENNTEDSKMITEKIKNGFIKLCPCCKSPTEKIRDQTNKFVGCNKIFCSICSTNWCWLCGKTNIDYDHYNPKNDTPCAQKLWEGTNIS